MPRPSLTSLSVPLAFAAFACAPRPTTPTTPVLALEPTQMTPDAPEAAAQAATTYGELVHAAAQREGEPNGTRCVFEREAHGLRMVGTTTPALRPLPQPAPDLDALLAQDITVNVLTPFGRYGVAPNALTLVSFTYTPPTREAVALVITDQGIALRGSQASAPMRDKLTLADAVQAVSALSSPATAFVSAEAPVPASALVDLLAALESKRIPVALAVSLAPATRLPTPPIARLADTCPNGLPETSEPEGALDVAALTPALSELRTRAAECLSSADPRGAAGGRLSLLLRVAKTGMLANACIDSDETGDARLRGCILEQAQKLKFPEPTPSGSVDLALPLTLVSAHPPAAPLLCPAP
jgi:hypothetical protein